MQALKQELPTMTKEAYFDYRDRHEGKYEFHDGMIIAMADSTTHTRLGGMGDNDCRRIRIRTFSALLHKTAQTF